MTDELDIPTFLLRAPQPASTGEAQIEAPAPPCDGGVKEFHPLAEIFPLIEGPEFEVLVEDIGAHGLHDPIDIYEDKVLDGRHRYRACLQAGVDPIFTPYRGDDPLAYVVSRNLKRRHLDENQRAMVASKLATLGHGGDRSKSPIGDLTQQQAADLLNVSKRSVERAKVVQRDGTPELQQAVERGEISVSAAADVAALSKEQQAKAVAGGQKEVAKAAKQVRAVKAKATRKRDIGADSSEESEIADPSVIEDTTPTQRALNKAFRDGYDMAEATCSEKTLSVATVARVVKALGLATQVADNNELKARRKSMKAAILAGDDKAFKRLLTSYVAAAIIVGARKLGYCETGTCTVSVERMARPATLDVTNGQGPAEGPPPACNAPQPQDEPIPDADLTEDAVRRKAAKRGLKLRRRGWTKN